MPTLIDIEDQILLRIRKGDEQTIDEVYLTSKGKFKAYATKLLDDDDVLEDIFQDAVIVFYENVRNGKITSLKSSISTYINGIGKYMLFRYLRSKRKMSSLEDIDELDIGVFTNLYMDQIEKSESTLMLQNGFEKLGEPCVSLLRLFYYEEKNNSEIATILGYANADVIKSQKYRCMKTLKAIMKKIYKNDR